MNLDKKVVAFDIDDTLVDTFSPTLAYFNEQFGHSYTLESAGKRLIESHFKPTDNALSILYGLKSHEVHNLFLNFSEILLNKCEPFQKALDKTWEYVENGWDIKYITARNDKWYDLTHHNLIRDGFPPGELFHNEEKSYLAKSLGVQHFYEDNAGNAMRIHNRGIDTFIIDGINNQFSQIAPSIERLFWRE